MCVTREDYKAIKENCAFCLTNLYLHRYKISETATKLFNCKVEFVTLLYTMVYLACLAVF